MVRKIKNKRKKTTNNITESEIKFKKVLNNKIKKGKIKECLLKETGECQGKIISAHSIQNNRYLNKISKKGKVIIIKIENNEVKFLEEGRKRFSVFTGFCQKHDKEIFQPIEDIDYISSDEQKYLYVFRSLAREFHTKKEILNIYSKQIEENPNLFLLKNIKKNHLKDLESIKKEFELIYNELSIKKYESLIIKEYILEKEYLVVTNGAFIPRTNSKNEYIFDSYTDESINNGNLDPVIFLNVFPLKNKTYILLSFFKKYEKILNPLILDIEKNKKREISSLIIKHCEVIAFNPDYIQNKFTTKERNEILKNFSKNLNGILTEEINSKINLFVD